MTVRRAPSPLIYRSIHGRSFTAAFEQYRGLDYSSRCFVFPAQSSAFPGMFLRELEAVEEFAFLFGEADKFAVARDLPHPSLYITDPGSINPQDLPVTRTLALFVTEFALFRHLENRHIKPSILTGHSFGEFAALAACGSIEFDTMLGLIVLREQSCPPPHALGHLLSVACGKEELSDAIAQSRYQVAIINSPSRTVIGIAGLDEVKQVERKLEKAGISYQKLENVPHPYHTELMAGCQEYYTAQLDKSSFLISPPKYPLYSSVLQAHVDNRNFTSELVMTALKRQLNGPMDFHAQILRIHQAGIFGFIESGPGLACSRLISEILRKKEFAILPLSRFITAQKPVVKHIDIKDNSLLQRISEVVSRLTGYELQKIQVRERFQDDLGIDSIKKAEILFTVLEEEGLEDAASIIFSDVQTIQELGEVVVNTRHAQQLQQSSPPREPEFETFKIVFRKAPFSKLMAPPLIPQEQLIVVKTSQILKEENFHNVAAAVNEAESPLLAIEFDSNGERVDEELSFSFLMAMQALFTLITVPLHLVAASYTENLLFAGACSFFKSLKKEHGDWRFVSVLLQSELPLRDQVLEAAREQFYTDLSFIGDNRHAKQLVRMDRNAQEQTMNELNGSIILVIGGAKGITYSLISHLARKYSLELVICGRSGIDEIAHSLESLKEGKSRVTYFQGDATDIDALTALFHTIKEKFGRLDYIINGAGCQVSALFTGHTDEEIRRVLDSKVTVARNILDLCRNEEIRKIIWFSSIVSWAGNSGQSVYAFANGAIDYLAEKTSIPVVSLMWPPWKGTGMMSNEMLVKKMESLNISLIDGEKAFNIFEAELLSPGAKGAILLHDRTNTPLYHIPLTGMAGFQTLMGTFVYQRAVSFQQDISLASHPFLKDHCFQGSVILPFSYMITVLLFQSCFLGGRAGRCRNFHLHNPIPITGGVIVSYNYSENEEKELTLSINSLRYGFHVVVSHGTGSLEFPEAEEQLFRAVEMENLPPLETLQKLDTTRIYGEHAMWHGPLYQVIRGLYGDGETLAAILPLSTVPSLTGNGPFDSVAAVLELSIQMAGFKAFQNSQVFTLPEAVGSFTLDDTSLPDGDLVVRLMSFTHEENFFVAHVAAFTGDGRCVAQLRDLRLREIQGHGGA